jgi:hypothetical protein
MSSRSIVVALAFLLFVFTDHALAQRQTTSDPQALAYAAQSIAALTGGTQINDVTLTGSVIWTAGSDTESGTAKLKALGVTESRLDLMLTGGTRSEVRDSSTGTAFGQWILPGHSSGYFSPENCFTDPVWFFPALGSLSGGPSVVLLYVGQEARNGATVQHIRSYSTASAQSPTPGPTVQQLSTVDFYLDSGTLLPSAVAFNSHPDTDPSTNIPIEVDFSLYQSNGGVMVPQRIQRYLQGSLSVDMSITGVTVNSGLTMSTFAINY